MLQAILITAMAIQVTIIAGRAPAQFLPAATAIALSGIPRASDVRATVSGFGAPGRRAPGRLPGLLLSDARIDPRVDLLAYLVEKRLDHRVLVGGVEFAVGLRRRADILGWRPGVH
jgi:hypothetical protein